MVLSCQMGYFLQRCSMQHKVHLHGALPKLEQVLIVLLEGFRLKAPRQSLQRRYILHSIHENVVCGVVHHLKKIILITML